MWNYAASRLLLLPITLFFILVVNFTMINLAPGEPSSYAEISANGMATAKEGRSLAFSSDERYLQFREFYGLTLPILFNDWPWLSLSYVETSLFQITFKKKSPQEPIEIKPQELDEKRILLGDQARFVMPLLLRVLNDPSTDPLIRKTALHFFIRGGSRLGFEGHKLTEEQKEWNRRILQNDEKLRSFVWPEEASEREIENKIKAINQWFQENETFYRWSAHGLAKLSLFFFETRIMRYLSRIATFDFGSLRNDPSKTVWSEVTKRLKYSLTLSILPMLLIFALSQCFGLLMACYQGRAIDHGLNFTFLVLYALPVFVVSPFLIEKVALHHHFPFTDLSIPISGFTSEESMYREEVSYQRLLDIARHIALPLVAIMYGSLASEARLSKTAVLEVLRQDFVRTARAKGLSPFCILFKHVGKNASITLVTSLASSFGLILGGTLIVETIFDINGFGYFFYDAVINRDYNVILFSSLAGSLLSLTGYLIGDLSYMWLDPRINLD